jgi:hypothetical protein
MSKKTKEGDLPVFEVLKKIKDGHLDPALLSKETRELCVEALAMEGYGSGQIASLLKRSDRTIRRIMVSVREKNALIASPELMGIVVGELVGTARNQSARLKQIARSAEASPLDKARVEFLVWKVNKEVVDKLHQVGYLSPTLATRGVQARVDSEVGMSDEDLAIKKIYSNMGPMDREKLIEKLHRDILGMEEEEQKEEKEAPEL